MTSARITNSKNMNNTNSIPLKFEFNDITKMVNNLDLINSEYKILSEIKKSTKKGVYIIQDKDEQKYIMKVKLRNFVTECELETYKLIKKNKHTNIISINKLLFSRFFFIVIYDFIEGVNMMQHQYYTLYEKNIIEIYNDILNGIQYLHRLGIYHCDIKPDNIIITKINNKYTPIIIDFDLSSSNNNLNDTCHVEPTNYELIRKINKDIQCVALVFYFYFFHNELGSSHVLISDVNRILIDTYEGKYKKLIDMTGYILDRDISNFINISSLII